jgi:hypothetical protein
LVLNFAQMPKIKSIFVAYSLFAGKFENLSAHFYPDFGLVAIF